jgi:hypothetical protein
MDYAMTVKTADYAVLGIPQLVIGSRYSMTRRIVERCKLGAAIDDAESIDRDDIEKAAARFQARSPERLKVFKREYHLERFVERYMSHLAGIGVR